MNSHRVECCIYTYHLPYWTRREICNLFDADQSWKTLGGQYFGMDATQLTLIGQAILRNASPTDELFNKLDSQNVRIVDLCSHLKQMNHCRALELLKPYLISVGNLDTKESDVDAMLQTRLTTLNTPDHSFVNHQQVNMVDYNGLFAHLDQHQPWPVAELVLPITNSPSNLRELPEMKCHKQGKESQTRLAADSTTKDPGEEVVRMACASNRKRTSISDQEVVNQLRLIMQINYFELKLASDDFSDANILGNGGFASVYRGHWKGTDVAIKRLKCNLMDQALNELTILNSYRIDNILPIYGISIDGPEACLVYQFMSNGSLEDRLSCKKNSPPLTWNQRALIGEGVAKGLYYLHTLRDKPLVHGDVKSANVLLDSQFIPKLGDFGLARQVFKGKNFQSEQCTHCTVSSIHGTSVYLPPEYLRHKILSPAVDVYSYGIVLLEMATGRRAYDGKRLLIDVVEDETQLMSQGQIGYSLKDSKLADETQNELKIWYELLIKLGLNCADKIKKKRPDMGRVLACFGEFRNSCQSQGGLVKYNKVHQTEPTLFAGLHRPEFQELVGLNCTQTTNQRQDVVQNKSALMSFEEEFDASDSKRPEPERSKLVDDMIPLLTELGVAGKQD